MKITEIKISFIYIYINLMIINNTNKTLNILEGKMKITI